ncbi:MAG: N-acetylmuramoyl-L-alanine amidase [Opitutales bacterium]|nr:N-acetylmuramoyl-L-alanine amidase [Opitutales bacterium]
MTHIRWNLLFLAFCAVLCNRPLLAATPAQDQYYSLSKVATQLGMKAARSVVGDKLQITLSSQWSNVVLRESQRSCTINDITVHLSKAVIKRHGTLYLSESDYNKTIIPLLLPQKLSPPKGCKRIVLDPGHGGKDNGAENKSLKLKEKHLALSLAQSLKGILEQRGYTVYLTRSNDTFIELDDRPKNAGAWNADLFISLHFNASATTSVRGAETYILPPAGHVSTSGSSYNGNASLSGNRWDEWNMLLGYYVQKQLVQSLPASDRGLKRARFAVLRTLNCPGILVEGGFVSNNSEGANIGSAAYRKKMAIAIADAVDSYSRTFERVKNGK